MLLLPPRQGVGGVAEVKTQPEEVRLVEVEVGDVVEVEELPLNPHSALNLRRVILRVLKWCQDQNRRKEDARKSKS